jgi:hypothetical protein
MVTRSALRNRAAAAGFTFEGSVGPRLGYFARFAPEPVSAASEQR